MWRPDHQLLARQLSDHFGIAFDANALPSKGGYPGFELFPLDCPASDAFRIVVRTQWRSLHFEFQPGAYAGELVLQMGNAATERVQLFTRLTERCREQKAQVGLKVNGSAVSSELPETWPADWRRVELALSKSPAVVNTEDAGANDAEIDEWSRRFLGLVLALVPLEENDAFDDEIDEIEGLPEGAVTRVLVNRYERSRINRAACIEIHGCSCKVCGFDFGKSYGEAGDGFIHVHHLTPVSEIGEGYRVNPVTDLVPLCANCHSMAHRKSPPFSLDDLCRMRARRGGLPKASGL